MGLDIRAYSKLEPTDEPVSGDDIAYGRFIEITDAELANQEKNFPGRAEGLKAGVYTFGVTRGFKAGSYGGYGEWRNALCEWHHGMTAKQFWAVDGNVTLKDTAFAELISFSDCQGIIGPVVAAKLAKDFQENQARVNKELVQDSWWRVQYSNWRQAFELAADGGCVEFT